MAHAILDSLLEQAGLDGSRSSEVEVADGNPGANITYYAQALRTVNIFAWTVAHPSFAAEPLTGRVSASRIIVKPALPASSFLTPPSGDRGNPQPALGAEA